VTSPVTAPARPGHVAAALSRWGPPRPAPADPLSAAAGLTGPGGRPDKTERPHPRRRGHPTIILSPGQRPRPADPGKAGCSGPAPRPPRLVTPHRKATSPDR
jgi:hypothetical protein